MIDRETKWVEFIGKALDQKGILWTAQFTPWTADFVPPILYGETAPQLETAYVNDAEGFRGRFKPGWVKSEATNVAVEDSEMSSEEGWTTDSD